MAGKSEATLNLNDLECTRTYRPHGIYDIVFRIEMDSPSQSQSMTACHYQIFFSNKDNGRHSSNELKALKNAKMVVKGGEIDGKG